MEIENSFEVQARKYLTVNHISENGYGYIAIPVSSKIRAVIDRDYLSLFAVRGEDHRSGRDTAFVVSKKFNDNIIELEQDDIRLAIGPKGTNLVRLIKAIDRRVTFVAL